MDEQVKRRVQQAWREAAERKPELDERGHVDLSKINAEQLLLQHRAWESFYDPAAFDPEGERVRFYSRGLTVWSGFPGTGKSTLIGQSICEWLKREKAVFIASMEESKEQILLRLVSTAWGTRDVKPLHIEKFLHCYGEQLFISTAKAPANLRPLLEKIRDLRMGQGIHHAVIDSLMCLAVSNESLEGQRRAALALHQTALTSNVHVHLVAHPRKLISVDQEPDLNDVAGAREIAGIADTVLFVRRGKPTFENAECSPLTVLVRKQRHFDGRIGDVGGWFHIAQRQFHPEQFSPPRRYLPEWAYGEGS